MIAGPSCSGKTAVARELQATLPEPWLVWEADRAQPPFPRVNEFGHLVTEPQMLEGNLRAICGYLDAGFNVIAEIYFSYPDGIALAAKLFAPFHVTVARLVCSLAVLEERERSRSTTYAGTARAQFDATSWEFPADLTVDSETVSPDVIAREIAAWLEANGRGSSFGVGAASQADVWASAVELGAAPDDPAP